MPQMSVPQMSVPQVAGVGQTPPSMTGMPEYPMPQDPRTYNAPLSSINDPNNPVWSQFDNDGGPSTILFRKDIGGSPVVPKRKGSKGKQGMGPMSPLEMMIMMKRAENISNTRQPIMGIR